MARKKKNANETGGPTVGHNSGALTEDQERALHYKHCREYEIALMKKKEVDASFRNTCKLIKSEGDSVVRVKKTIEARTPEGEAKLRTEVEETAQVLRWAGTQIGTTKDFFPDDPAPAEDRAFQEGKRAGLNAESRSAPYDSSVPQSAAWYRGYDEGQTVLQSAFAAQANAKKAEEEFDDLPEEEAA